MRVVVQCPGRPTRNPTLIRASPDRRRPGQQPLISVEMSFRTLCAEISNSTMV
jgi:hypothetical protein